MQGFDLSSKWAISKEKVTCFNVLNRREGRGTKHYERAAEWDRVEMYADSCKSSRGKKETIIMCDMLVKYE